MNRIAIVTGANGQDGSYLCDLLLEKGYVVYACVRRSSQDTLGLLESLKDRLRIRYIDMVDGISIHNVFSEIDRLLPDYERCEVYNLAAQSHVHVSFYVPDYTSQSDGLGFLRILECVRQSSFRTKYRVYQASTSELYGDTTGSERQSETTPFKPRSPYATAKLYAYWIARNYRESYGMFVSNGILFNHESPRRGTEFVTRKITKGLCDLKAGRRTAPVCLGNLDAKRDWGHAYDYVRAMWMILQTDQFDDWVVATGEVHSVREVIALVLARFGVSFQWKLDADGMEQAVDETGKVWIQQSKEFMRPNDVTYLCGDSTKIREQLGWKPLVAFEELIYEMIDTDRQW
jgi:GDPmannose 4,6-dehydratase